jgi:hypothetical protein
MLLPFANPAATPPPPTPPPHNKDKTTVGQKVARSPPSPNPTAHGRSPSPHLCPPPVGQGQGEKSETRAKVKMYLVPEYQSTKDVRTIRVQMFQKIFDRGLV